MGREVGDEIFFNGGWDVGKVNDARVWNFFDGICVDSG